MRIAVLGGGAGGAAAGVELVSAGHEVRLWSRSQETISAFQQHGGIGYEGVLGTGLAKPELMTWDLAAAIDGAEVLLVCLPAFAHAHMAHALAQIGSNVPVVLDPGQTGGALEFRESYHACAGAHPPVAELSTLTYVARKYSPERVTITGRAKSVRLAGLPGGEQAVRSAQTLFPAAKRMYDVLACDLANVNMVLHAPGAVLAAAWIEAKRGDFTFYVEGMTPGVARVMRELDLERRAVAEAFGHELPSIAAEMQAIGTVEASITDTDDLVGAIASGEANRRIEAPDSLRHRYYREDFGFGLLPFTVLAAIAGVNAPVAASLLRIAETLLGTKFAASGRSAERMGIAGLDRDGLLNLVGAKRNGG